MNYIIHYGDSIQSVNFKHFVLNEKAWFLNRLYNFFGAGKTYAIHALYCNTVSTSAWWLFVRMSAQRLQV